MTAHDHAEITTMSTKAMALVDAYQASTKEIDRQNAIESVADLLRALEKPADLIVKLFFSVRSSK